MAKFTTHPLYDLHLDDWRLVRDCAAGEKAVKAKKKTYLIPPSGLENDDYNLYVQRASFYGATGRTRDGLVGAVMRKRPAYTLQGRAEEQIKTRKFVTQRGESAEMFFSQLLREVCSVSRAGVLVDAPPNAGSDFAPYAVLYKAEQILDWAELPVFETGRPTSYVKLFETYYEGGKAKNRVRKLYLGVPSSGERGPDFYGVTSSELEKPVYYQEVWVPPDDKQDADENDYLFAGLIVPRTVGGRVMDRIPFEFVGPLGREVTPVDPVLLALANVNLGHYRNAADHEWGLHFTALPTAWAAGFDRKQRFTVGATAAWVSDNPEAKCGYLEFTGAGLAAIREELARKEKHMAVLGARLLEEQKAGVESAEAVKLRTAGEFSALMQIATGVSESGSALFGHFARWLGEDPTKQSVKFNTDFNVIGVDPARIVALMQATQAGAISWETFFFNMDRGEIYPEGRTAEDEKRLIEAGMPDGRPTDPDKNVDGEPSIYQNKKDDEKKQSGERGDKAI